MNALIYVLRDELRDATWRQVMGLMVSVEMGGTVEKIEA